MNNSVTRRLLGCLSFSFKAKFINLAQGDKFPFWTPFLFANYTILLWSTVSDYVVRFSLADLGASKIRDNLKATVMNIKQRGYPWENENKNESFHN